MKKNKIKSKTNKNQKTSWNNVLFWVQTLYAEFYARKVKVINKVLREKSHGVVRRNKSRFLKQKTN